MAEQEQTAQRRVEFDAEVSFRNGGALQTQGFRLDIPADRIADDELGELLVRHLGLLMVDKVVISNKLYLNEPHKGSRGVAVAAERSIVVLDDLGTRIRPAAAPGPDRLVDLPTVLVRLAGGGQRPVDRAALAAFDLAGCAVLLDTGRSAGPQPRLTEGAAALLAEQGAVLFGTDGPDPEPAAADVLREAGISVLTALRDLNRLPPAGVRLHAVTFPGRPSADGAGTGDGGHTEPLLRVYGVVGGG